MNEIETFEYNRDRLREKLNSMYVNLGEMKIARERQVGYLIHELEDNIHTCKFFLGKCCEAYDALLFRMDGLEK